MSVTTNSDNFPYRKTLVVAAVIVGAYFFLKGIIVAKVFLAPLLLAFILSLVAYPFAKKLEKLKLKRGLASLLSVVVLFFLSLGVMTLFFFQIQSFVKQWPKIQKNMAPKIKVVEDFLVQKTPISADEIDKFNQKDLWDYGSEIAHPKQKAWRMLTGTGNFLADYLLTLVYIFFILAYRRRGVNFIIHLLPDKHRQEAAEMASEITSVASAYLGGKIILMGTLAVAYAVGLGLSGVENFILVSLVATLLTLIPYIGNVVGFILVFSFGFLATGDVGVLIGVVITFSVSHFLESYVLQPYIMGGKVNIHPFVVLLMVLLGGAVWGIAGMILAVPVTAISITIFMHIEDLREFGQFFRNRSLENNVD